MSITPVLALQTVLLLLLLAASAFFSGSETALFSLSAEQLQALGRNGARGRRLVGLLKKPTQLLSTLLIGNTLCPDRKQSFSLRKRCASSVIG